MGAIRSLSRPFELREGIEIDGEGSDGTPLAARGWTMSDFQGAKLWLTGLLGLSKDAAHVHVGLAVFLGVALLFRLPLRDWRPIVAAILAALAGEAWDLVETWNRGHPLAWRRGAHDLWNTLFWPFALSALARWTRLFRRDADADAEEVRESTGPSAAQ